MVSSARVYATLRRGFTLVELLVVIAIIGILISLILPAVQSAREAARKIACSNNQHQLSLAMMNYAEVQKTFPGFRGNVPPATPVSTSVPTPASWAVLLMPYMEGKDKFEYWAKYIYDPSKFDIYSNQQAGLVGVLVCPSARGTQNNLSYGVNAGQNSFMPATKPAPPPPPATPVVFLSNQAVEGVCLDQYVNPTVAAVAGVPAKVSIDYVQSHDGTTNTLLILENCNNRLKNDNPAYHSFWNKVEGTDAASFALDTNIAKTAENLGVNWHGLAPAALPPLTTSGYSPTDKISSFHSGGMVNVSFCDGRQTSLKPDIDPTVFARLMMPYDRGGYAVLSNGLPPNANANDPLMKNLVPLDESMWSQ